MGLTPNRSIPYADATDAVAAYPTTDRESAERLDALLYDTGWVPVTINAGFAVASGMPPMVRRIGSVVHARGGIAATGVTVSNAHGNVMTLPAGFAPSTERPGPAGVSPGAAVATLWPKPTGAVDLRTGATISSWYVFTVPWTVD